MIPAQVLKEIAHDPLPDAAGTRGGELLICGPGSTLYDDLRRWRPKGDVMAVNAAGGLCGLPLTHWATCHPELIPEWGDRGQAVVHVKQGQDGDVRWPLRGCYARTSGMFAAVVGYLLGYDCVLAGLPADASMHVYRVDWSDDYGDLYSERAWKWLRDNLFGDRVKSLSGNTAKWLGTP